MKKFLKILFLLVAMMATTSSSFPQTGIFINLFTQTTVFTTTGGGAYCAGGLGVPVGLSGSIYGIQYHLQYQGVNTAIMITGTGAALSAGNQTMPGVYSFTSYDPSTGCWLPMAGSVTVVINPQPHISFVTNGTTTFCTGGSVTITANVTGGTPPYSYQWQYNGANIPGATSASYTAGALGTGMYRLLVNDGLCSNDKDTLVTVNPLPTVFPITTPNVHFCQGSGGGTIAVAGSVVNMIYQVKNGIANVGSTQIGTGAALTFTGITVSGVPLTVVATNPLTGCSATMSGTVSFIQDPLPSNPGTITGPVVICKGETATYTVPYITNATGYMWSVPNGTILNGQGTNTITIVGNDTITGTISVLGTNACGVGQPSTKIVTVRPTPLATITSNPANATICNGQSIGLVANGGSSATWYPGAITGLTYNPAPTINTPYMAIVSNIYGCKDTANISVTVNPTPTVLVSVTPLSGSICQGASATMTASGATTYVWTNDSYTLPIHTVTPSLTTTYTVIGTTNNCSNSASMLITVHANPVATITSTPANANICSGQGVTLTAGPSGNTYSWNIGGTSPINIQNPINNSSSATTVNYAVTVTDGFGCNGSTNINVTVNPNPTVTASSNSPICSAGGGIHLNGSSSIGGSYAWSGPAGYTSTTQNPIINNPTTWMNGTYTFTVTTVAGCIGTSNTIIHVNNPPTLNIAASDSVLCQGFPLLLIAVSDSGTINWTDGLGWSSSYDPNPTVSTPHTGDYTATAVYGGCTVYKNKYILVNPLPTVTFNLPGTGFFLNTDSEITLSGSPAGGIFSGMGVFNGKFYPVVAGNGSWTLTYDFTDGNGCTGSDAVSVIVGSTGLDETATSKISLYPNPVSDVLNINTGDLKVTGIQLFDGIGKLINSFSGETTSIDFSRLATGVYFVQFTTENDGALRPFKVIK